RSRAGHPTTRASACHFVISDTERLSADGRVRSSWICTPTAGRLPTEFVDRGHCDLGRTKPSLHGVVAWTLVDRHAIHLEHAVVVCRHTQRQRQALVASRLPDAHRPAYTI